MNNAFIHLEKVLAAVKEYNDNNEIKTSCEGKVVEIDGKKYKLTSINSSVSYWSRFVLWT